MANSTIPGLVAVTVPALTDLLGVRQSGDARDKKLTVTQLLSLSPSGGDVSKVGTPVNNQLGIWTGDGTIEGDVNVTYDGTQFRVGNTNDNPALRNVTGSVTVPTLIPLSNDSNTGIGGDGADRLAAIAGGLTAQRWDEANAGVQVVHRTSPALTAFSGGGQGGATLLTNSYNVVTTVAAPGDSVRLQTNHELGTVVYCKNEGANGLNIFPASGDDLGNGTNVAASIAAGEFKCFITTVAQATWTELLPVPVGGGGDVTKVGTPVDNQLGVWTGDGTIEGTSALQFNGSTFTMDLGGGDFRLTGKVELQGSNRPAVLNESSSLTNPTFAPLGNSPSSGLGGGGTSVSLVANTLAGMVCIALGGGVFRSYQTNLTVTAFAGGGQASATLLTSSNSIITTVATTGDSVKLTTVSELGAVFFIKNDGANACDVFPGSGKDIGAGVDVAISLAAGTSVSYVNTGSSNMTAWIVSPGGGGDVIKVGTPVNNQLGVWTGDGTLEGDANLAWSGTILTVGGTIRVGNNGGGAILNEQVTSTNPSLIVDVGDVDTGFGSGGSNNLAVIVGAQTYATYFATGAGDGSLNATYDLTTGKTASTTQTQGQATQNSPEYSEITTVANPNDVITLGNAAVGRKITVVNRGANVLQIFPGSGGDLGQGVNASTTLAVDHSITWLGLAGGVWAVIGLSEVGTGDVTKVGTPANNQIGVWTGDGTIEGDSNFLLTGTQLILPTGSSAGLPELKIGSGQTGFFTASATQLRITVNGTERFTVTNDIIQGFLAGSGQLHNRVASATVPTFTPNTNDGDTGIGGPGGDVLSLIAGGVEVARAIEASGTVQLAVPVGSEGKPTYGFVTDPDTGFFLSNTATIGVATAGTAHFEFNNTTFGAVIAGGPRLLDELPSATNPSFAPNKSDTDTGIGWTSADILSLIAGAVEGLTIAESGGVITLTFRGDLQAAGGGGAGPVMRNVSASPSVPTLIPNQADPDTGLTRSGIDEVALVGGGLDVIRCGEVGGVETIGFYTTAAIAKQTGVAVSSAGIHAALVALGLIAA